MNEVNENSISIHEFNKCLKIKCIKPTTPLGTEIHQIYQECKIHRKCIHSSDFYPQKQTNCLEICFKEIQGDKQENLFNYERYHSADAIKQEQQDYYTCELDCIDILQDEKIFDDDYSSIFDENGNKKSNFIIKLMQKADFVSVLLLILLFSLFILLLILIIIALIKHKQIWQFLKNTKYQIYDRNNKFIQENQKISNDLSDDYNNNIEYSDESKEIQNPLDMEENQQYQIQEQLDKLEIRKMRLQNKQNQQQQKSQSQRQIPTQQKSLHIQQSNDFLQQQLQFSQQIQNSSSQKNSQKFLSSHFDED